MLNVIRGYWIIQIDVNLVSGNIVSSSVSIIPEMIRSLPLFPLLHVFFFRSPQLYIYSHCLSILFDDLFSRTGYVSGVLWSALLLFSAIAAQPGVSQFLFYALNFRQLSRHLICTMFSGRLFHLPPDYRHLSSYIFVP